MATRHAADCSDEFHQACRNLGRRSKLTDVSPRVFDVLGREVRVIQSGTKSAGTHSVSFDATGLPSGVYFYRLGAGELSQTRQMIVSR